jgi:ubiquinone/menaquinone biosynthesis C-methylase UbiE
MLAMARFITAHVAHLWPLLELKQMKLSQSYNRVAAQGKKTLTQRFSKVCKTTFTKGNAENTSFQDKSFDIVTECMLSMKLPDKDAKRF